MAPALIIGLYGLFSMAASKLTILLNPIPVGSTFTLLKTLVLPLSFKAIIKLTTLEILCIGNLTSLSPAQNSYLSFKSTTHIPTASGFASISAGIYEANFPSFA